MALQRALTTRRHFLERSALGVGSVLSPSVLLGGCADDSIDPVNPPLLGSLDPSKGVDYFAYLGNANFSVKFEKPTDLGRKRHTVQWPAAGFPLNQMLSDNLQIAEADIGITSDTGRFQWHLTLGGNEIVSGYAEIAPLTGDLGEKSTILDMLKTPSTTTDMYSVSYGFFDAGADVGSLTNQDQTNQDQYLTNKDQFYIYATTSQANWMGSLTSGNPSVKNAPFSRFVLPGAHDAGMFDTANLEKIMRLKSFALILAEFVINAVSKAGGHLPEVEKLAQDIIHGVVPSDKLLRILINMAFTQKDSIVGMLDLGIRYFDFRPGYNFNDTDQKGELYHQHNFIPGHGFSAFMQDICQWLQNHPSEIVVVSLVHSGFYNSQMRTKPELLWQIINSQLTASNIGIGNKQDLGTSYGDLIQANKRLIVLPHYGFKTNSTDPGDPLSAIPIWDTVTYDSYSDHQYQTTDVNKILSALNSMNAAGQINDYTVLQLQGTASATKGADINMVTTSSDTASPLMSTKAQFDHATYPWLLTNGNRFRTDQLLVCLNDFSDNALTDYCTVLTRQRANG